jgi:hypothetical protein
MKSGRAIERLLKELEQQTIVLREILEKFHKVDEILGGDMLKSGRNLSLGIFIIWKYKKKEKFMNSVNKFMLDNATYDEIKKEKIFYEFHWGGPRYLHKVEITGVRTKHRFEHPALRFEEALDALNLLEQFTIRTIQN